MEKSNITKDIININLQLDKDPHVCYALVKIEGGVKVRSFTQEMIEHVMKKDNITQEEFIEKHSVPEDIMLKWMED